MKQNKPTANELREEYKLSDFTKLERGKYAEKMKSSSNIIVLDDDMAAVFPNSAAVNKALHSLVDVARKAAAAPRPSEPRSTQRRPRRASK